MNSTDSWIQMYHRAKDRIEKLEARIAELERFTHAVCGCGVVYSGQQRMCAFCREDLVAKLEAELEIERRRPIMVVKADNSPKIERVKALAKKWREHAANYKESRGYWGEYVSDCADELEDTLEDTLADLTGK